MLTPDSYPLKETDVHFAVAPPMNQTNIDYDDIDGILALLDNDILCPIEQTHKDFCTLFDLPSNDKTNSEHKVSLTEEFKEMYLKDFLRYTGYESNV